MRSIFNEHLFEKRYFELVATFVVFVILLILRQFFRAIIRRHVLKYELDIRQRQYANKFFNFMLFIVFLSLLCIIWDVSFRGLTIYFASFFTIVGVALFANWSILSNVTASIILFFNSPIKIGSKIEIMDKDHPVVGTVIDINFFAIQIQDEAGCEIWFPNNLAMQKPIKQLER